MEEMKGRWGEIPTVLNAHARAKVSLAPSIDATRAKQQGAQGSGDSRRRMQSLTTVGGQ
jgi:hypothetical protein